MINLNNINLNEYNFDKYKSNNKINKEDNLNSRFQESAVYNSKNDSTGDKHILDEINSETDSVEKQEDLILYYDLKKAGVEFKNISWEQEKSWLVTFPPTTAPGYIRQAFREALLNIPESERGNICFGLSCEYDMYKSKNQIEDSNSISYYNNLISCMLQNNEKNRSILGGDIYRYTKNLLDNFSFDLQKIK
ncbi:hypothetical protein [Clostridium sp. BJN0013]|uniref:hypothetical protein n=1 Tax=Clostridium sp. BJN0013 TaxID=3236840 RepID=UPI0034C67E15